MGEKSYDSIMYVAQRFRDCLMNEQFMQGKYGGIFPAKQSGKLGDVVSFEVAKINSRVTFKYRGKKPHMILEMSLTNGDGNERIKTVETILTIKRSKSGRISNDYYPKVLKDFVMPNMKAFYKEWLLKS